MTLSSVLERGLDYLRASQAGAGFWSDWQLPPGESRMWTTAYIGFRLSSLPPHCREGIDENLLRADAWLRASEFREGGWGYAEQTGPDADSTALALLFLRARGYQGRADRQLAAYQQADGGFSTYRQDASFGAWVQSQPEVSATTLLALLPTPFARSERMLAAMRYLKSSQRPDGLWNSYWWTSCLYATQASLAFLDAAGERPDAARLTASLGRIPAPAAFESALLLMCLALLGKAGQPLAAAHARGLQAGQLPDGSWPSRPMLRLTARSIGEPWLLPEAGPVFSDEKRLFTTATVLAALGQLEAG
ncbi:MAG: hypothetical protein JWP96_599 [Polaromonas sp.]|nr:hypothetical protein [Polaromonas sp.]